MERSQLRPELGIGSVLKDTINASLGLSEFEFSSAHPNSHLLLTPFSSQPHHTVLMIGFKTYLSCF